jgi:hypothetical protein
MPCNSNYMNATNMEVKLSQVACLLDELEGNPIISSHWNGYHPKVYCQQVNADKLVSTLCKKLQKVDISKYSLEMQLWWREHQIADKERIEEEIAKKKTASERQRALAKLNEYERNLLGLKE